MGGVTLLMLALLGQPASPQPILSASTETDLGFSREAAEAAVTKLRQIQQASVLGHSLGLVRISEEEANSYLHYEMASSFPPGVSKVRLKFRPNRPLGSAEVDFDKMRAVFSPSPNPVGEYFLRGVHTLAVEGTLSSANGIGQFNLEAVILDGIPLPRAVVDFLIENYLKTRYPAVVIDRPFPLPYSIGEVNVKVGTFVLVSRAPDRF